MLGNIGRIDQEFGEKGSRLMIAGALGLPVPPGFALCPIDAQEQRESILQMYRQTMAGRRFSVRSSPMSSMPGVLATILNAGWDFDDPAVVRQNEEQCLRFFRDFAYHAQGIDNYRFGLLDKKCANAQQKLDAYFEEYHQWSNEPFPRTPEEQLIACIRAVQGSFESKGSKAFRQALHIADRGCGVVVQQMVYGDKNDDSGAGVLFTRNVVTGEREPYGEYLRKSGCETIVQGAPDAKDILDLKEHLPQAYDELMHWGRRLEHCFENVQDIEFVVEDAELYILQIRDAECNKTAIPALCRQLIQEQISTPQRLRKIYGDRVEQQRTPHVGEVFARGELIYEGQVSGRVALKPDTAHRLAGEGVIPVINSHFSLEVDLLLESVGVIVMGGGKTSHLAVMVKKLGLPCLALDGRARLTPQSTLVYQGKEIFDGDKIGIDGANIILL